MKDARLCSKLDNARVGISRLQPEKYSPTSTLDVAAHAQTQCCPFDVPTSLSCRLRNNSFSPAETPSSSVTAASTEGTAAVFVEKVSGSLTLFNP